MNTGLKEILSVRKFYFLDYFYILLVSIDKYSDLDQVFSSFRHLKEEHRLGESKYRYRKLTISDKNLSQGQIERYVYTFNQVIIESKEYGLVDLSGTNEIILTKKGKELLHIYQEENIENFYFSLLGLMERSYNAFSYIINLLYTANVYRPGLLVFPFYSPLQLSYEKSKVKTTNDIREYSITLVTQLELDIQKYLGTNRDLKLENEKLFSKLYEDELLSENLSTEFDSKKYNTIIKRFRDFWTNHFLKEIYHYEFSMNSFDLWTYRGKQIGVVNVTEFYPNLHGKIVYPTSVIRSKSFSPDFKNVFEYDNGNYLYIHYPNLDSEHNQGLFVDNLVKGYFNLRRTSRSYFISLPSLREVVCYNLKISEMIFEKFLNKIYKLNLSGQLKIKISLEVDKLPEETKVMYSTREPILIDGKYRNIIAIDVSKGDYNEQVY